MKTFLRYLFGYLFLIWLSLLINIITWLLVFTEIKPGLAQTPLHYNIFYGIDSTGNGYQIYFIPAIGLAILFINYIFFRYAAKKEVFATQLLSGITLAVQIFVLIAILFLRTVIVI